MNKNYVDQENMEEMGLKEESISKKNEKNVNERHDQDGQRYEDGTSMNGNKERQENDLKRYRDGTSMKENREAQQQDGQRYEDGTSMDGDRERQENDLKKYRDGTSMKDEKENRQKNRDSNPENQDEIYYQKVGQEESPGNQGYRN